MNRQFYLDMAIRHARFPIGADLVLREHPDHAAILLDGRRYADVLMQAAQRYHTPLAIPVMDLMLEKAALLATLGVPGDVDSYHFSAAPDDAAFNRFEESRRQPLPRRLQSQCDAIRRVAQAKTHVPVGMCIGPVSLMTKLLADPITPIFLAGGGTTAAEDEEVRTLERTLELAMRMVLRSVDAQVRAGARAMFIAEPAANKAYFSPNQIAEGSDIFQRFVLGANRRVKGLLDEHGVDLIFHCCGELIDPMVTAFASLDPVMLSLGSSRKLWEDARLVPQTTVLYGNLPSKKFYSDDVITEGQVAAMTRDLAAHMRQTHHPFVLGTECDVLHVAGCEERIRKKVAVMLASAAG